MKFDDTFLRIIKADLTTGRIVPALMGEPGIGKTSFALTLAEKLGTKLFVIQANQLSEKADLTGVRTVPTPDNKSWMQVFFPHQTINDVNQYAKDNPNETPLLILEEINRTDADVTSALLSLSTERTCGNTRLEDNIRIIVTGNTKGNVNVLDTASLSRFSLYDMEADTEVFLNVMGDKLNYYVRTVLENNPELIFVPVRSENDTFSVKSKQANPDPDADDSVEAFNTEIFADEAMLQFTTPRTIHGLSDWLNTADDTLLRELLTQTTKDNVSALDATLQAHTGDTEFTAQVGLAILNDLNKPKSQNRQTAANAITPPAEPSAYKTLTSLPTVNDIENHIATMTTEEKENLFLYIVCNPVNQITPIIMRNLGHNLTELSKPKTYDFAKYLTNGMTNKDAVQLLTDSRSALHASLTVYIDLIDNANN